MTATDSTSTDVATQDDRTPAERLVATVASDDFKAQAALALPEGMPPARFVRVAVTALMENPDLAELEKRSVFTALLKSASDGLLPDGREAALVPFRGKAVYVPMIGGFRKIAAEHGWTLTARAVREGDHFTYELGEEPRVKHEAAPLGQEPGKLIAAYAVGRELRTGARMVEVMTAAEIEKVRKTSKQPDGELWGKWPERAYEKTVARRLFKLLPLGDRDRVQRVLDADALEPGDAEAIAYGPRPSDGSRERPEVAPSSRGAEEPAESPTPPAPTSRGFTGEEPEDEVEVDSRLEADRARVITLGKHEGETLGELAEAGNRAYLRWLASEAVEDEDLREAAGRVLANLR